MHVRATPGLHFLAALASLSLACGQITAATPSASPSPSPTPSSTQADACRYLTAGDVKAVLGVQAARVPLGSPPPAGTFLGACDYASSTSTRVSLSLYSGMAIDAYASAPGYRPAPGIGDAAFVGPSTIVVRKGPTTFQVVLNLDADQAARERALQAFGSTVADRLP
jgi:hypothetical protein